MTEIQIVEHAAQPTAVVREHVDMHALSDFFGRAFTDVMATVQAQGVEAAGPPFALYHGKPTDAGVDVEAGVPVPAPIAETDRVVPSALPSGRVVEAIHVGPYDTMERTYGEIMQWMQQHGLEPADDMWECYLTNPEVEPDPARWQTKMFWPVR